MLLIFFPPHIPTILSPERVLATSVLLLQSPEFPSYSFGRSPMTLIMSHPPPFGAIIRWSCHPLIVGRLGYPASTLLSPCILSPSGWLWCLHRWLIQCPGLWANWPQLKQPTPSTISPWPLAIGPGSSYHSPMAHLKKYNSRLGPTCLINSFFPTQEWPHVCQWMTPKSFRPSPKTPPPSARRHHTLNTAASLMALLKGTCLKGTSVSTHSKLRQLR